MAPIELRRVGKKIVEKQINLDFKNKEDVKRLDTPWFGFEQINET